jgi:hypothetical protein
MKTGFYNARHRLKIIWDFFLRYCCPTKILVSQFLADRTAVNTVHNVPSINQVAVIFLDPFPSFSVYPVGSVAKTVLTNKHYKSVMRNIHISRESWKALVS